MQQQIHRSCSEDDGCNHILMNKERGYNSIFPYSTSLIRHSTAWSTIPKTKTILLTNVDAEGIRDKRKRRYPFHYPSASSFHWLFLDQSLLYHLFLQPRWLVVMRGLWDRVDVSSSSGDLSWTCTDSLAFINVVWRSKRFAKKFTDRFWCGIGGARKKKDGWK